MKKLLVCSLNMLGRGAVTLPVSLWLSWAGGAPVASMCPGAGCACSEARDAPGPAGGMADGFSPCCL